MRILLIILLTFSFHTLGVAAQERASDPESKIDPKTYSCAEHIELLDAEDGRSDVRVVWAHGYYSALIGFDEDSPPISVCQVIDFSKRLEALCRKSPNKLFLVAIKEIKERDDR